MIRGGIAAIVACALVAGPLAAQVGVPQRPGEVRRDPIAPRDTTVTSRVPIPPADSIRRRAAGDSAQARVLIKWAEPDSVMTALMSRPGYSVTRYQGERVNFNAVTRVIRVEGSPAGVGRAETLVVGDTIIFNDSTRVVVARGDTVFLRDPGQGAGDIVARGSVTYNIGTRRGSVSNIATSVESGETYYVAGGQAAFVGDTTRGQPSAFYVRNGQITSCSDPIPDYYFQSKEIKLVSKNLIVARPATLYVAGVPVFWLPFLFQDIRKGRRSGVLPPRFGLSELFRNSPTYRRQVENLGYYFNLGDYVDAQVSLDWRSGARATAYDPGWTRVDGQVQYRWLDRFMTGRMAAFRLAQRDGTSNTAFTWAHSQDFSQTSRLNLNINYVTNTAIQRRTTFNPRQVLATISSQAAYNRQLGPFALSLGGSRTQYPGRKQVDLTFPTLSLASQPIAVTRWLDWTPQLSVTSRSSSNVDQFSAVAYRYFTNPLGALDSTKLNSRSSSTTGSITTPITILGFQLGNVFTLDNRVTDYPVTRTIVDVADSSVKSTRTFGRSYYTGVDWQPSFALPTFLSGSLKVSPSISLQNVDGGGPFWVRSELTGGRFVNQSKRVSGALGMSPTLFGIFRGFGPVSRLRHSITPGISYSYTPRGNVSDEFLRATNRSRATYIGDIAQNRVTLTLSQVLEAKLRSDTSSTGEGRKLKLLAMNFTPLTYDFERARRAGRGFSTPYFGYDVTSDLLPGFSFNSNYSLYRGDIQSDTAVFKPFRTEVRASFTINGQTGVFAALNRLFGRAVPSTSTQLENVVQTAQDSLAQQLGSVPVAGTDARNRQYAVPNVKGWQTSISYSSTRQRPPSGGIVRQTDPRTYCDPYRGDPLTYQACLNDIAINPRTSLPVNDPIAGGVFFRVPPQTTVQANSAFRITPNWAATWGTAYDVVNRQFTIQQVTLQRELHDWRAIFAFVQSPNGNFAFNFFIALKANPDVKFDYRKNTYRPVTQ